MKADWSKLLTTGIVIAAATLALILGKIADVVWLALVGPYAGLTLGQGLTAATGGRPGTAFTRPDNRTRAGDAYTDSRPPMLMPSAPPFEGDRPATP